MIYKTWISFVVFIFLLNGSIFILADDAIETIEIKDIDEAIERVSGISNEPSINSRYATVIDRENKTILYGKNENTKTPMASTTKIMTAIVTIENADLNSIVKISGKAAGTGGSRLKLKAGDSITVRDLLYGLMLRSGNDAAIAIAEYVGGSVPEFVNLMNEKASVLELKNTHFETPHGLDAKEHYTTAYELALLADYALHNKVFEEIVRTKTHSITINGVTRTISNTNELLGNLNGVYGVKTGFTNGAGRCLVTAIKRGDIDVICIVLGADTKKMRTIDSIALIEYVFKHFEKVNIETIINDEFIKWREVNQGRINIEKGIKKSINVKLEEYIIKNYTIKQNTKNKIKVEIDTQLDLIAPIKTNTKIGELIVFYDDKCLLQLEIQTGEEIKKKGIIDYILEIGKEYPNYLKEVIK